MLPTACIGLIKRPRSRRVRDVSRLVRARSVLPCPVVLCIASELYWWRVHGECMVVLLIWLLVRLCDSSESGSH